MVFTELRGRKTGLIDRGPDAPVFRPGDRYDRVAILLHWALAALLTGMLASGWVMVELVPRTAARGILFNLHKSFGVVTLLLLIARLGWRALHAPPPLPGRVGLRVARLAGATHLALYGLPLAQALTGSGASLLGKFGLDVFGLAIPSPFSPDPNLRETLVGIHGVVPIVLVTAIGFHLVGVIFHAWAGDARMLHRILPSPRGRRARTRG